MPENKHHKDRGPDNRKKVRIIAKVSMTKLPGGSDHCVKYSITDWDSFMLFFNKKFPDWVWMNVYEYVANGKGAQIDHYTKDKPPPTGKV